jgi:hypothetical protein
MSVKDGTAIKDLRVDREGEVQKREHYLSGGMRAVGGLLL